MLERLQKYMASCGVDSRRHCEEIIKEGRVKVNGDVISELGAKVDSLLDEVTLDGKVIKKEEEKVFYALYKPCGYVCTVNDEKGRATVLDLMPKDFRIFPIGRLDYDSSGLLLLTNDGDTYNKVIHPRESIDKVYEVLLDGQITLDEINKLQEGVDIGDYVTKKAYVSIVKEWPNKTLISVTIHEGKNRQIRRMLEAISHEVLALNRVKVGAIELGDLKEGEYRELTEREIQCLRGENKE